MRKLQNLKSIEYMANFETMAQTLLEWNKVKPTEKVKEMIAALNGSLFYTHELETNQYYWEKSIEQYRADKLRAVERARAAEKKVEELEKELAVYKKRKELGL